MKKRVPITVENKKTVERKNNFTAGNDRRTPKFFRLLFVTVVFRSVAYLLNKICLKHGLLYQISYTQVLV